MAHDQVDRQFGCHLCDKAYGRKSHLQRHIKQFHGEQYLTSMKSYKNNHTVNSLNLTKGGLSKSLAGSLTNTSLTTATNFFDPTLAGHALRQSMPIIQLDPRVPISNANCGNSGLLSSILVEKKDDNRVAGMVGHPIVDLATKFYHPTSNSESPKKNVLQD